LRFQTNKLADIEGTGEGSIQQPKIVFLCIVFELQSMMAASPLWQLNEEQSPIFIPQRSASEKARVWL
jgi:hypothetical protein